MQDLTKLLYVLIVAKFYLSGTITDMSSHVKGRKSQGKGSSVISAKNLPKPLVDSNITGASSIKLHVKMLSCLNAVIVNINPGRDTTGTSMRKKTERKKEANARSSYCTCIIYARNFGWIVDVPNFNYLQERCSFCQVLSFWLWERSFLFYKLFLVSKQNFEKMASFYSKIAKIMTLD